MRQSEFSKHLVAVTESVLRSVEGLSPNVQVTGVTITDRSGFHPAPEADSDKKVWRESLHAMIRVKGVLIVATDKSDITGKVTANTPGL